MLMLNLLMILLLNLLMKFYALIILAHLTRGSIMHE
jgi:hypothetical protein